MSLMEIKDFEAEYKQYLEQLECSCDLLFDLKQKLEKILSQRVGFADELDEETKLYENNLLYILELIAKIDKIIEMSESVSFSVEKKEAKRNNIHIFPLDSDDAWVDMNYPLTGLWD